MNELNIVEKFEILRANYDLMWQSLNPEFLTDEILENDKNLEGFWEKLEEILEESK